MSKEIQRVVNIFSKFLDSKFLEKLSSLKKGKEDEITVLDRILKLPIYAYKFLTEKEAKILEDILDIHDIEEASILNPADPFERLISLESTADPIKATEMREKLKKQIEVLKDKFPNLEYNLKKTITISSLIKNFKETKEVPKKRDQKIIVVGLDNAGKTAIINKFGNKLNIKDLAELKPTKGIERQKLETKDLDLIIWDFGGQEQYRQQYLENPEKYFFQSDLILYVIDVQDSERFDQSLQYFDSILDILITLEENPYFIIFIHKVDPDIKNDPEILLNIEYLKEKIKEIFDSKTQTFDYEIYLTSIYSLISNEPKFSRYIKEIMKNNISLTDPTLKKIDGLGKILEETMNAIIKLSESLSQQLANIDERLRAIESGAVQIQGLDQLKKPEIPTLTESPQNIRSSVLDELRQLFAKKKQLNL
ncbi:MAG: ADP-ribosylation factor-like protein [Promethearchaeota archaeon]